MPRPRQRAHPPRAIALPAPAEPEYGPVPVPGPEIPDDDVILRVLAQGGGLRRILNERVATGCAMPESDFAITAESRRASAYALATLTYGRVAVDRLRRQSPSAADVTRRLIVAADRALGWMFKDLADYRAFDTAMAEAEFELLAFLRTSTDDVEDEKPPAIPPIEAGNAAPVPLPRLSRSHSPDYRSIEWNGEHFEFKPGLQAESIQVLWDAMEKRRGTLTHAEIAERIGGDAAAGAFRLDEVFRDRHGGKRHAAWGTMIERVGRGRFRLKV